MIPKKIHYCWYGQGKMNDTLQKCIASWHEKLPEYEIIKWDETNTPFHKFPFLKLLYKQKKWSFITDYVRLYSIYTQGGIYLDTDIEILKDFGALLNEKAFVGFQTNLEDSIYPINSAVIGSEKGNSFVLDCLKETEKKQRLQFNAMGGPPIVSKVLIENYGLDTYKEQLLNGVKLLPTSYFYPFSWEETYTKDCIKPETICIHWWQDSWKNKKKGFKYILDSFNRKLQKTPVMLKDKLHYLLDKKSFFYIQ
ncbi:Glycosyltransferase sugar-binding region containing DXD motif-containing protein [Arenibacter nanhaiticus]|uniref:Glycosyltransferase sugar-binding region containing DXD motif-containing protein n=2 Tax=Arenibacter nanhaiticus TaxID=558155 RepID=A0A1M6BEV8_9FLAO|nr:Glycosyltransferase sugar-binding region containing DXD motif-containing protein [Arenibacter nanhaiticus]